MWFKIKALFAHSRTIMVARLYTIAGVLVVIYDGLGGVLAGQDFTPISTRVMDFLHVSQDFRTLVWGTFIAATGEIFAWLRRITTQSLAENKVDAEIAAPPTVAP